MVLFTCFGLLGLALAGVGIYGVITFGVAQRTQEFGVRMALGAQRSQVVKLVMREGVIVAVVGPPMGLGGAYLVGRASSRRCTGGRDGQGCSWMDRRNVLAVALIAWLIPALRASRVEPMVSLRDQ